MAQLPGIRVAAECGVCTLDLWWLAWLQKPWADLQSQVLVLCMLTKGYAHMLLLGAHHWLGCMQSRLCCDTTPETVADRHGHNVLLQCMQVVRTHVSKLFSVVSVVTAPCWVVIPVYTGQPMTIYLLPAQGCDSDFKATATGGHCWLLKGCRAAPCGAVSEFAIVADECMLHA